MRLASLYSGGKDSAFSLYLAEQQGHDVPYLVNIVPEDRASWIFHTPNLNTVPAMAESMGKKLVLGHSTGEEGSDMEGMRRALEGLDVEGIVTGAIWSDYQWDRMNMVCGDLGLKLIAPLWRKDQDMLMDQMLDAGIEAVHHGRGRGVRVDGALVPLIFYKTQDRLLRKGMVQKQRDAPCQGAGPRYPVMRSLNMVMGPRMPGRGYMYAVWNIQNMACSDTGPGSVFTHALWIRVRIFPGAGRWPLRKAKSRPWPLRRASACG